MGDRQTTANARQTTANTRQTTTDTRQPTTNTRQPTADTRHSKYYIDDRNPLITLSADGQLFRVHRYMFELESEKFKTAFTASQEDSSTEARDGSASPVALPTPVTAAELEALLGYFYFRQGLEEAKFTQENWRNLLSISYKYECKAARERSIQELEKLGSAVENADKFVMAMEFEVKEWVMPACVALIERQNPLTFAEAEKLGLEVTVQFSEAREKHLQQKGREPAAGADGQQPIDTAQLVKDVLGLGIE